MKKIMGFLSILILGISFSVGAVTLYKAKDISYTPANEDWKVNDIQNAINDLYSDYLSNNKKFIEIIKALQEEGVNVNNQSTLEEILTGIDSLSPSLKSPKWIANVRLTGSSFGSIINGGNIDDSYVTANSNSLVVNKEFTGMIMIKVAVGDNHGTCTGSIDVNGNNIFKETIAVNPSAWVNYNTLKSITYEFKVGDVITVSESHSNNAASSFDILDVTDYYNSENKPKWVAGIRLSGSTLGSVVEGENVNSEYLSISENSLIAKKDFKGMVLISEAVGDNHATCMGGVKVNDPYIFYGTIALNPSAWVNYNTRKFVAHYFKEGDSISFLESHSNSSFAMASIIAYD